MVRVTVSFCAIGAVIFLLTGCISFSSGAGHTGASSIHTARSSAEGGGDLRVMSFNVRVRTVADILGNNWALRKGLVVQAIRNFDPDLLGTQEGVASQVDYLRKNLRGYGFSGAGRNDGRRSGEMCALFYKSDRFQKLDEGHFWLSERPEEPGSRGWGAWFPRMVTWVKLRPIDGGRDFYFFNTHLDAFSSQARLEASKLLRDRIERISAGAPVVLTGDFNTGEGTEPYRVMTAGRPVYGRTVLIDTLRAAQPIARADEGTRHGFNGRADDDRIDWILATPDFRPIAGGIDRARRGGRYPSDHFPVTAVLQWRRPVASLHAQPAGG